MKTVLKKIGVVSAGKIIGVLFGIIGIIRALAYLVFPQSIYFMMASQSTMMYSPSPLLVVVFLIIGSAIIGFIFGAVTALLYNFVAPKIGGIDLEMK